MTSRFRISFKSFRSTTKPVVRVDLTLHRDLKRVVVAMTVEVGALAEDALVLFFR